MRGLTLTPPWGTLIAIGAKRIETRSWKCPASAIGIPMAIHQAKGLPRDFSEADLAALCASWPFAEALAAVGITSAAQLPRGRIVAVATPVDHIVTGSGIPAGSVIVYHDRGETQMRLITEEEHAFGDYGPDRHAWLLDDIAALAEPVPCRGSLSLWRVPAEVEVAVRAQLGS
jgi:activating signal cointegrator 1